MRRPFLLKIRSGSWHYRLAGETDFHSTGIRVRGKGGGKAAAEEWVIAHRLSGAAATRSPGQGPTLREYSERFFVRDTDPRILRRSEEGRTVGTEYITRSRRWLKLYVWEDEIAGMRIGEIRRSDLLEFRRRLIASCGEHRNTVNKVLAALKTILREAVYLQDLQADPTVGIGTIKEERIQPGVFSEAELRKLFPGDSIGPWLDRRGYACFLVAATTGMRRGEILALRWGDLDLDGGTVRIQRAWKRFEREEGKPKSGKARTAPLPDVTVASLLALRDEVIRHHADDLVLCYDDGQRLGGTWWQRRFERAMAKAKIDWRARHIRPHSLRHSLATVLAAHEYDREKIRAALGWSDEAMREHYTHLGPEDLRGQAEIVDRLLGYSSSASGVKS